jgi:WD40 repeat protein
MKRETIAALLLCGVALTRIHAQPAPDAPKLQPVLVLQQGHIEGITSVAFSRDGTKVITGSSDRSAIVWDVDTGRQMGEYQGHTGPVTAVAFSPDGRYVVTASSDGTARLRDGKGKTLHVLRHGRYGVRAVAFGPGSQRIVTGCDDDTARLWDVTSGRQIRAFKGHHGPITSVAISTDAKRVVTGAVHTGAVAKGKNNAWTARLWDTDSGRFLHGFKYMTTFMDAPGREGIMTKGNDGKPLRVAPHEGSVHAVAISPDGKHVLAGEMVFEASTGKLIHKLPGHNGEVSAVAFSPDGKQVVTAADKITLWDTTTGRESRTLVGKEYGRVTYSPDGKTAFGTSDANQVQNVKMAVAFSPDSKLVLTANAKDTAAHLWDAASGKEVRRFQGMVAPINSVAFAPDGKQFFTGSADQTARLRDAVSGKVIHTLRHADFVTAVAISRDGKLLATGSGRPKLDRGEFGIPLGDENTAELWDAQTGERLWKSNLPSQVIAVRFAPGGRVLLTGDREAKPLHVLDVARHMKIAAFGDGKGKYYKASSLLHDKLAVSSLAFSADGKQALVAKGHHQTGGWQVMDVELWDRGSDAPVRTIKSQALTALPRVSAVALSPDGKQALIAGGDKILLWDLAGGAQLRTFKAHFNGPGLPVEAVAFSPDGKQFVAGNADKSARLWNTSGGDAINAFVGHTDRVTCVSYAADGKQLLTGSADGTARLWSTETGRELCRLLGFRDGTWAAVTPDNAYLAPRGALDGVTFRVGKQLLSFDQFDLKFNRPDKVLESIGLAPPEMIAAYRRAYQKRLKRMNFTEEMLSADYDMPEVSVTADARLTTRDKSLKLKVKAADPQYLLDRLHIDVNGVPVHGSGGMSLRQTPAKSLEQSVDIELSAGKNKVDVSVQNEKGAESLRETILIHYEAPPRKANLYVVAVGVSDYVDDRFRLKYADKDARDLAGHFEKKRDRFGDVKVLRILNRDATRDNILKAKDFLKGAHVDDLVVVFFAGHGLLDRDLDYYFATADIDFKQPSKRGLNYEAIEDLLDGVPARKKLLLMDTCHSGELDKEDVQVARAEKQPEDEIKVRSVRGLDFGVAPRLGLDNSFQLLQSMFSDLRRGTGAVVISSAGGAEYALESAAWKNGVFTHAVLRGLRGEADKNRDGRVQVSELRHFVEQEVARLTRGRQTPTARRENLVVDFTVD